MRAAFDPGKKWSSAGLCRMHRRPKMGSYSCVGPKRLTKLAEGSLQILSRKEIDHLELVFVKPEQEPVVPADPLAMKVSIGVEAACSAKRGGIAGGDSAHGENGASLHSFRHRGESFPEALRDER